MHFCLTLPASIIVDAGALRAWLVRETDNEGVAAPDRGSVRLLVVPSVLLPASIEVALRGPNGLLRVLQVLLEEGRLVRIPWDGIGHQPTRSLGEIADIEQAMFAALTSSENGPIVGRFVNRGVSGRLTRWLIVSCVTPIRSPAPA